MRLIFNTVIFISKWEIWKIRNKVKYNQSRIEDQTIFNAWKNNFKKTFTMDMSIRYLSLSFEHCVVCPFSTYGIRLSLLVSSNVLLSLLEKKTTKQKHVSSYICRSTCTQLI